MVPMNLSTGQPWTQAQRKDLWTQWGRGGEDGKNGDSIVETYTLPYGEQIASGNWLFNSGSSKWCSVDNLEESDGV